MSAREPDVNVGAILAGRWQIQDYIGSGELGEVYGVRDMHGAGSFALKLFWPTVLSQPEIWSELQQSARTASGLGVEGVARAYDFGIDANRGRPFFVVEHVSWASLAQRVRLRGPLTTAELASALAVLARALDAAHAIGLSHRDLKPENVFVSPENPSWVRVSDFGVALLRAASPPPPGWGGTIGWVGPDAADPKARSTPAMDVFAVGLVTFFALSGGAFHRAAQATPIDPGALWQELSLPPGAASARARELGASLDPAFDGWFQRALSGSPQARFASVGEMASAFDAITRNLLATQSQNALAIEGDAATIAQPLIFQPEPRREAAPARAVLVATAARSAVEMPTVESAQYPRSPDDALASSIPGVKRRNTAPLFIGGAVMCLALIALGAVALYRHQKDPADAPRSEPSAVSASSVAVARAATTTTATTAITAAADPAPAVPAPAPAAAPGAAQLDAARPNVPASAPTNVAASAKTTPVPAKAKPAATILVTPAQPAAAFSAPSTLALAPKPTTTGTKSAPRPPAVLAAKKKCGTIFIPCK